MSRDMLNCRTCFAYKEEVYHLIFAHEFRQAVTLIRRRTAHRKTHHRIVPSGAAKVSGGPGIMPAGVVTMPGGATERGPEWGG